MSTTRVEAFSDGVIAIIITIMVLEFKTPSSASAAALLQLAPVFAAYSLSFVVVAIMWVNHHHLIRSATRVDTPLLWTNMLLLFWMSLIPFVTAYLGRHQRSPLAVAAYGGVLALAAASFTVLRFAISRHHLEDEDLTSHHQRVHLKNTISTLLYTASVPLAFVSVYVAYLIFMLIPVLYFLPESKLAQSRS